MEPIHSSDLEKVNEVIKVPEKLYSKDGREFAITAWQPVVKLDCAVTVKIEATICSN